MKQNKFFLVVCMVFAGMVSATLPAHAQCADPVGAEGDQIYNTTHKVMQFCDGDEWVGMARSPGGVGGAGDNFGSHVAEQDLDASSFKVIEMGPPVGSADAATKAYVDSLTGTNETDPQVGIIDEDKWCTSNGTLINCQSGAPETPPGLFVAAEMRPNNTAPGTVVTAAWTDRVLNTSVYSNLTGASLAGNAITLPAGTYYIDASTPFAKNRRVKTRLVDAADDSVLLYGTYQTQVGHSVLRGTFELPAGGAVKVQYYAEASTDTNDQGYQLNIGGEESYAVVSIKQVAAGVIADREPTFCAASYTPSKACLGSMDPAQHLFSLADASLTQNQCTAACEETGASCCTYISGTAGCYGSTATAFDPVTPPVTYSSALCGSTPPAGGGLSCAIEEPIASSATDGTYVYTFWGGLKAYSYSGGTFTLLADLAGGGWHMATGLGKIFSANGQTLSAYTFNGTAFTGAGTITVPGSSGISDIFVGASRIFVVTGGTTNAVRAYTHSGSTFTAAGSFTTFTGNPSGVWARGDSPVYVREVGGTTLRSFTYNGSAFTAANTGSSCGGTGQLWGDATYVYAACNSSGLRAYNSTLSTVGSAYDPGTVWNVWSDGAGTIYAAGDTGIQKLTFDGTAFTEVATYPSYGQTDEITGSGSIVLGGLESAGIREVGCAGVCDGGGNACTGMGGTEHNGACWFLGAVNAACDTTCTGVGATYNSSATLSYAGSGGSNANCQAVMTALGATGSTASTIANAAGCYLTFLGARMRGTTATTATATIGSARRACACEMTEMTCGDGGSETPGYFVISDTTKNGDFNGIVGANYMCLADLKTKDWKGKDNATVNSTTVKAFLCTDQSVDPSVCNNALPNEEYFFSAMGGTTTGGASFTTDATGSGPNNADDWSGATYFNTTLNFWTGRETTSATKWQVSGGHSTTCTDWIDGTAGSLGLLGSADDTTAFRWARQSAFCNFANRYVCMVHPDDGTSTNDCTYAGGYEVGGACWFIGDKNESCTTVCTNIGGTYDAATLSYGGSGGSNANCDAILNAIGTGGNNATTAANAGGCYISEANANRYRGTSSTTNSYSSANFHRACACVPPAMPSGGGPTDGYVVMTAGTFNGDFAGTHGPSDALQGANAACLHDLQNNDWLGKSTAALTAGNVEALLCTGTDCQGLDANKTYKFARSGSPTTGGHSFNSGASAVGPNDSVAWSNTTRFGATTAMLWWSNRQDPGDSNTQWGNSPDSSAAADTCNNWTSTSGSYGGRYGYPTETDAGRWARGDEEDCGNDLRLICVVHPTTGGGGGGGEEAACTTAGGTWVASLNACYLWGGGIGGQSCDTVCGDAGGTCNLAKTVAIGSGGNNAACLSVIQALGVGSSVTDSSSSYATGCSYWFSPYRYTGQTTTCEASRTFSNRACACDFP